VWEDARTHWRGGRGGEDEAQELFEPNLYVYDAYPGGIGFSEPLFEAHGELLERTREMIAGCGCERGCPSCVGPSGDTLEHTKAAALSILEKLCAVRSE
jgi:DEAD/DEAH box helicase domain-containing protein